MSEHKREHDPKDEVSVEELDDAAGGSASLNNVCVSMCGNSNCMPGPNDM